MEKMPWIKTKVKEQGYWTKERVFEEGAKYSTKRNLKEWHQQLMQRL